MRYQIGVEHSRQRGSLDSDIGRAVPADAGSKKAAHDSSASAIGAMSRVVTDPLVIQSIRLDDCPTQFVT
jgi:hypothetical protein